MIIDQRRVDRRAISVITWMEVMIGALPDSEKATRKFLANFRVLELTSVVQERAVLLRRDLHLKLPDAMRMLLLL